MKTYLAYIRVSTVKQEEHSSSLQEQRSAIEAYATRNRLQITEWFEETETAAKQGRRLFSRMIADLSRGKAKGVIIHKIDRSARNLKDWARLGDLIDAGVDVHFAHESLDLGSRGGRLAADIQAVVAADYIRNLRQEVRKGIQGRLKQGLYPLPAPRGYANNGKGMPKTIHPVEGPLVKLAFELYATGEFSLQTLSTEMFRRGLRSKSGTPLSLDATSAMLHNPLYVGVIHIKRTGESFDGVHKPLVRHATFKHVQAILAGRTFARPQKHVLRFRRMIRCSACGRSLTGERRKGHVYYRCHSQDCQGTILREQDIDAALEEQFARLTFADDELEDLVALANDSLGLEADLRAKVRVDLKRDLTRCEERIGRLTDAYLDGVLDKETFETRKEALFLERRGINDRLEPGPAEKPLGETALKIVGRGNMAFQGYFSANPDEKRDIAKELTSDLLADRKKLAIRLRNEFQTIINWGDPLAGAPCPGRPRTFDAAPRRRASKCELQQLFDAVCAAVKSDRKNDDQRRAA